MNKSLIRVHSKFFQLNDIKNIFTIFINIIDMCNYSCYYCFNNWPRTNIFIDINSLYNFIIYIKSFNDNIKYKIEICGGEPTLHPDLFEFCQKIINNFKDDIIDICIYSNGSQNAAYYQKFLQYKQINFILTYHNINNNQKNNFIQTITTLKSYLITQQIMIIIMYENRNYTQCIKVFDYIYNNLTKDQIKLSLLNRDSNNVIITHFDTSEVYQNLDEYFKRLHAYTDVICYYNDNTITYMSDTHFSYIHDTNFYKWLCYAGYRYISIYPDGNVYKCSNDIRKSLVGNIYTNININIFKTPSLCLFNTKCPCIYSVNKEKVF